MGLDKLLNWGIMAGLLAMITAVYYLPDLLSSVTEITLMNVVMPILKFIGILIIAFIVWNVVITIVLTSLLQVKPLKIAFKVGGFILAPLALSLIIGWYTYSTEALGLRGPVTSDTPLALVQNLSTELVKPQIQSTVQTVGTLLANEGITTTARPVSQLNRPARETREENVPRPERETVPSTPGTTVASAEQERSGGGLFSRLRGNRNNPPQPETEVAETNADETTGQKPNIAIAAKKSWYSTVSTPKDTTRTAFYNKKKKK